jgi:hypothetical protein
VRRIYRNAAVRGCSGGRELAACKRLHRAPGEMEHITLPPELLKGAGPEIIISAGETS